MPDTDNGRVTLAVIQADIRHLSSLLEAHIAKSSDCHDDHETRIRGLETSVTRIEQKQGALAAGQGVNRGLPGDNLGHVTIHHLTTEVVNSHTLGCVQML